MESKLVDQRDMQFVLYEQLEVMNLAKYEQFAGFSRNEFDMVIEQAFNFAEKELLPANADGDKIGAKWNNGVVTLPPSFYKPLKIFGTSGWVSACEPQELGGQGLPTTVFTACNEIFHAANTALNLYPSLAHGVATMIKKHGTEEQKRKYLEKLLTYEWAGTMNLTEPGAGSALAQIQTKAVKMEDGRYRISGQKIFITGGEHDAHPNIIHPVLARIEGDPAGIKGISIFLVPKFHVNDDGSIGERNDVTCVGIEHKMGIRGSATCQMSFGDNGNCIGEILGKPCQGIAIMFLIMNEERLNVGIQSVGLSSAAYLNALAYARERKQGVDVRKKNFSEEPVAIINHPDVRRNLLGIKATVEGLRALNYFTAFCIDMEKAVSSESERKLYNGMVELLTPLCKAYSSIKGEAVCSNAMNIFGGYGYCMDYPMEQHMRDQKITALYEGTNAIHSIDLVARKLGIDGGRAFDEIMSRMLSTTEVAIKVPALEPYARSFEAIRKQYEKAVVYMKNLMSSGKIPEAFHDSLMFLEATGDIILGWMHLWQLSLAHRALEEIYAKAGADTEEKRRALWDDNSEVAFYAGKMHSAKYYISKMLPLTIGKIDSVMHKDYQALEVGDGSF